MLWLGNYVFPIHGSCSISRLLADISFHLRLTRSVQLLPSNRQLAVLGAISMCAFFFLHPVELNIACGFLSKSLLH